MYFDTLISGKILRMFLHKMENLCMDRVKPGCYIEKSVFELPGGLGGLNPPTSSCRPPYLWPKFDPGGVEFQPPYLSFAEVGMLLDSHFLLMQFLKYLQCDDLNVTTILIHTEDWGVLSQIVRKIYIKNLNL